ncbi:MAG: hypothetical protein O3A00_06220 [Planctomycetota bacterium]|nr:hypothetical protein [Planctomycetota bacterium]
MLVADLRELANLTESAIAEVLLELIAMRVGRRRAFERAAVGEIDVLQAIDIKVNPAGPATHHFREQKPTGHDITKAGEVDSRVVSDIHEPRTHGELDRPCIVRLDPIEEVFNPPGPACDRRMLVAIFRDW